jgi:hypothetical protein
MLRKADELLQLIFSSSTTHRVGPLSAFRVDGEAMRTDPQGALIATRLASVWHIDKTSFPRLQCEGSVFVRFERHSEPKMSRTFGAFDDFEMLDGVAYTSGRKVFASLNAKAGNWYCHEDGHYWSAMVVQDKHGEKSRRS